jgi:hypothetical protein
MSTILIINAALSIAALATILAMIGWAMTTAHRDYPTPALLRRIRTTERRARARVATGYTPSWNRG